MSEDVNVSFGGNTSGLDDASQRASNDIKNVGKSAESLRDTFSKVNAGSKSAVQSFNNLGSAAKLPVQHVQNLAFQMNDVFVGLASGQSVMTVFVQQGAQIAQIGMQAGVGVKVLAVRMAEMVGVIKRTTDAGAAAALASATASSQSIALKAAEAQAAVVAAETEVALAQAEARAATSAEASAAAQTRLATALTGVSTASTEAALAQNALAVAEGRTAEAAKVAQAATVTRLGVTGAALAAVAAVATVAAYAFSEFSNKVEKEGTLTKYRDNLGLTHKEMLRLGEGVDETGSKIKKLGPVTVTIGDTIVGVWEAMKERLSEYALSPYWEKTKQVFSSVMRLIIQGSEIATAALVTLFVGTYKAIKATFSNLPAAIGDVFVRTVNGAIGAINGLLQAATNGVNWFIEKVNGVAGRKIIDTLAPPSGLAEIQNRWAGAAEKTGKDTVDAYVKTYKGVRKAQSDFWDDAGRLAIERRKKIMDEEADALKANRSPKTGGAKKGNNQAERDQLAAFLEMKRAEQDAAQDDYQKKLAIEDEMLAAIKKVYGEDSKQYQAELRRKEAMEREWQRKKSEIEQQSVQDKLKNDEATAKSAENVAQTRLAMERDRIEADAALGLLSAVQKERALADLENRRAQMEAQSEEKLYQMQLGALNEQLKLIGLPAEAYRKMHADIEALTTQHNLRMNEINAKSEQVKAKGSEQVMQSLANKYKEMLSPVTSSVTNMLQGMYMRTMSLRDGLIGIADSIVNHWIQKGVEWAANWAIMELAKTGATTAGVAARTAAEATGATVSNAISAGTALKQIAHKAVVAAAGAYAAIASIPVVGPFLAPAAAAAALYGVYKLASGVFSAKDGMGEVANDGDMYQLHKKEMVLPAKFANPLRDMLSGGPRTSGLGSVASAAGAAARANNTTNAGDVNFHYQPKHTNMGASLDSLLSADARSMRKWIKNEIRNGSFKQLAGA